MEQFKLLLSKWLVFDGTDVSLSELEVHTDELFVNVKYIHIDNCIQPPEILEAKQHSRYSTCTIAHILHIHLCFVHLCESEDPAQQVLIRIFLLYPTKQNYCSAVCSRMVHQINCRAQVQVQVQVRSRSGEGQEGQKLT